MSFSGELPGSETHLPYCQRVCEMVRYGSGEYLRAVRQASLAAHDPVTDRLRTTKEAARYANDAADWATGLQADLQDLPSPRSRAACRIGCLLTDLDVEQIAEL